jgi:hypothetical protein
VFSLRSIGNKTVQICIQIVWPTIVPAFVEEDAADLAGVQLVPQVDVGLDLRDPVGKVGRSKPGLEGLLALT